VNDDDCEVCLILAIYCLIHGLDYLTIPPAKFDNQAQIFIFYTVMGFQIDQDDNHNPIFNEDRGTVTLLDDTSPDVAYNDACNQFENRQRLLGATNPSNLAQVTLRDLVYPNSYGDAGDSDDGVCGQDMDFQQDMILQQALE
jgi:hypothetical protein